MEEPRKEPRVPGPGQLYIAARKARRKETAQRRKGLRVQVLDPEAHYERELERILRTLAKWVARRGYIPHPTAMANAKKWPPKLVLEYLIDLEIRGDVECYEGQVYGLTDQGFAKIKYQPIAPILKPEMKTRVRSMADAKRMLDKLADPDVREAFDALYVATRGTSNVKKEDE